MITKASILNKINLKELIGTPFEDMMTIKEFFIKSSMTFKHSENFNTYLIIKGKTRHTVNTPEGGFFYRDFYKGDIPGLNFSIAIKNKSKSFRLFDIDMIVEEGSIIVYLPFEKIIDLEFKEKCKVLEKLIILGMEDHFKEFNLLLLKSVYSDEEFFIKYLETHKTINTNNSKEISEFCNINIRTLQRILKRLLENDLIERVDTKIFIKNQFKLDKYKEEKFIK